MSYQNALHPSNSVCLAPVASIVPDTCLSKSSSLTTTASGWIIGPSTADVPPVPPGLLVPPPDASADTIALDDTSPICCAIPSLIFCCCSDSDRGAGAGRPSATKAACSWALWFRSSARSASFWFLKLQHSVHSVSHSTKSRAEEIQQDGPLTSSPAKSEDVTLELSKDSPCLSIRAGR